MRTEFVSQISINKNASFTEIWREGAIDHLGKNHRFWLIHPMGKDENGESYEVDVRWFFQSVPRDVRAAVPRIISTYKKWLEEEKIGSPEELLKECYTFLNELPKTQYSGGKFKDSYELAAKLSEYLKSMA